jgi:hypothetical protein
VVLTGLVATRLAGRTVDIYANYATGARHSKLNKLASVKAGSDGQFSARVKAPPRRLFQRARYEARVGTGIRSIELKLPQSLASSSVKRKGNLLEVRGQVKRALVGKRNPIVIKRLVCGHYQIVGRAKPSKRGTYVVRFPAPSSGSAALYRAESMVRAKPGSRRYVKQYARAIGIRLTGQTG